MKSKAELFDIEVIKAEAQLEYVLRKLCQRYDSLAQEKPMAAFYAVEHEFVSAIEEVGGMHQQLIISYKNGNKEIEVMFLYRGDHNSCHSRIFKLAN